MLLLVTVGLVLAGLILLIVGFVQDSLTLIYLSIACAAVAGLALIVFSRLSRRSAVAAAEGIPAAGASPSPLVTAGVAPAHAGRTRESAPPAPRPATAARPGAAPETREPVAARQATAPEEDRFDPGEPTPPQPVRAAAPVAPAATTRLEQVRAPDPAPIAADASDEDEWAVDWGDEVLFPIEDYDELRVAEIIPLLPELDPDELEEVRDREAATKNRASILVRIDELMGNVTPPAAPPKPAPRKAPAARSAPPKAPAATSKTAAANKAAAPTKASASKAVASKAAGTAKAAAAKATRPGAGDGAKAAAAKAPAKPAPAAAKAQANTKKAAAKEVPAKTAAAKKASPAKANGPAKATAAAKETGAAKKAAASKSTPRKRG